MSRNPPKVRAFLASGLPLLLADRVTKSLAFEYLQPIAIPHQLFGSVVRLTLLLNRDAAMNLTLGAWSRWGFAAIAVIGVVVVVRLLRASPPAARFRGVALGLIAAGATGNLIDRLRWDRGVVDFIDRRHRPAPVLDVQHRRFGRHDRRGAARYRVFARAAPEGFPAADVADFGGPG